MTYNETGRAWSQTKHLSQNVSRVAGLALSSRTTELYALLQPHHGNCVIASVDRTTPERLVRLVATLPRACLGDGLALDDVNSMLYVANEGEFVPENGRVYSINTTSGTVQTIINAGYTATDGAFFEPVSRKLYVSEFLASAMLEIDPGTGAVVRHRGPAGVEGIDDFSVEWIPSEGAVVYGSSMLNGKTFKWPLRNNSDVELWAEGITSPTSVRPGCALLGTAGFFVTEGGSVSAKTTNRRVLF